MESTKKCEGIFQRLSKLPTVELAVGKAKSIIARMRDSNAILRFTVDKTEQTINYATPILSAVAARFDRPAQLANDVACQALGKLEEKFPVITKSPEELSQNVYNQVITPVVTRVENVKHYSNTKITEIRNYGSAKWNEFIGTDYGKTFVDKLSTTLLMLDKYMEDNNNMATHPEKDAWKISPEDELSTKVYKFSSKLRFILVANINQKQQIIMQLMGNSKQMIYEGLQNARNDIGSLIGTAYHLFIVTPGLIKPLIWMSISVTPKPATDTQETPAQGN